MTTKIAAAAIVVGLAVPAGASAATKVFAGTVEADGKIAMDVKVSKKGVPRKITELRGVHLATTCDISGYPVYANTRIPTAIKVAENGKFSFSQTDPTYGNTRSIKGKFKGNKVTGTFVYANHFAAEGPYPEENCHTDELSYTAKRGAPDVVYPARLQR
jgi:hypothetical protein